MMPKWHDTRNLHLTREAHSCGSEFRAHPKAALNVPKYSIQSCWVLALGVSFELEKGTFGYFSNNQPDGTTIQVYPAYPWL